ncbi:MAG: helix-turn-helix transcriptional regulator [Thermoproteota archaeon]|jgi:DNA-binding HxlR family transcriptional regulator|nr:helix-turn-helix transcriptional regulator [Thermoproteota archaeon]
MIELQEHLKNFGMVACPVDNSLKIFGQKYALHIVRNMVVLKQKRFGQFLGSIEGINTKTLSIRLRELEDFGIIKRTIIPSRPVQTEYSLTDKGMALEPLLADIATFSTRYESKSVFKDGRPRTTIKQIFRVDRLSEIYDY